MKRFFISLLLLALQSCVSSTDFQYVRHDVGELKKTSIEGKKELDLLKEKTAGIVKEDSFAAMQQGQAVINSRLSELSTNLQELRGRFEENKYFFEKAVKDSVSDRDLLRAQIVSAESQLKTLREKLTLLEESVRKHDLAKQQPEAAPAASGQQEQPVQAPAQPAQDAEPKKDAPEDSAKKAYDEALLAFQDRQYRQSREKFEAFLKHHPKTDLTDNAHFWIAETYFGEKDYESAILAYETLLKKFPESAKTPEAMRKQGFAFLEIGDRKTARIILEKLIEKFPQSRDADLAKKKLAETDVKKNTRKK